MGRFRTKISLTVGQGHSKQKIDKNTNHSVSFTEWSLCSSDFTVTNNGTRLLYDQVDTSHEVESFKNILTQFF